MLSKTHQSKFTFMKREMRKNGDQGKSSKSQRTTRISSPSAEASLPRSLCPGNVYDLQEERFEGEA